MNVDRYELRERLGQGTTGTVFVAFDPLLKRDVALKMLTTVGDDDALRRRFAREARALASLHHPNIVEVFDFGAVPGGPPYLVTELVRGPQLGALAARHGVLPEPALIAVGLELTAALAHAHARGIIHRALKPENVLLSRGRLVLTDFSIVKAFAPDGPLGPDAARKLTAVVGVPGFVAPEQLEQGPLDARTDIFALGALLYVLATGKLPYEGVGPSALLGQIRRGSPEPLQGLRPDVSGELSLVVHRCLEPAPDRRPHDALALRQALQRMLEDRGQRDAREILAAYERDPALRGLAWNATGEAGAGTLARRVPVRRGRRIVVAIALVAVVGGGVAAGTARWAGVSREVVRRWVVGGMGR